MRFLIILFIGLTSTGCTRDTGEDIKLLFTGDILLSRNVRKEISQKDSNPWLNLIPEFEQADLVMGNLEGAVGSRSDIPYASNLIFDISDESVHLMKDAGFSIITLENNHSNDLGPANKDSTILKLNSTGITPVNMENSPWFIKVKDLTLSVIAINLIKDRSGLQDSIPSIQIQQKLRLARSLSDFVIISIHWGNELLDWPGKYQRESADWLIDNGADLIIGHHPHVIQSPEIIKGKPVFFSLGNHLFDQKYSDSKKGLIVECVLKNRKASYTGLLTRTVKNSFYPEIEKRITFDYKKIGLRQEQKFHNYTLRPVSILQGREGKVILNGMSNKKMKWSSQPISLIAISEAKFDDQIKYLFTLEKHYSSLDNEEAPRPYVYMITDTGLQALWRGSGLTRPLIDASLTKDKKYLMALHRSDSFLSLNCDSGTGNTVVEVYQWNGFGFSGLQDSSVLNYALEYYTPGPN
jgi:poly-gamma-glutamate synthesis protein (capsule biosynthesis protein)